MRIALFDAFPQSPITAELEFINRCLPILHGLGHEAQRVLTTDEVMTFDPDVVIVLHETLPKLTHHFTVGLLWSPTPYWISDRSRVDNIRSWDYAFAINDDIRNHAHDIYFPHRLPCPIADWNIYPSAPVVRLPYPDPSKLRLAYVGAHWDGDRHLELLKAIASRVELNIFGPEKAWRKFPEQYRGEVAANGTELIKTLHQYGAVLAIHKDTHRHEDTPSARVFEGCAAKALVITDAMPSLKDAFGDSLSYVDLTQSYDRAADQVVAALRDAKERPQHTLDRIVAAHAHFEKELCLEVLLAHMVSDLTRQLAARRPASIAAEAPGISVIIRCGSRPIELLQRAVRSLEAQWHPTLELIFVQHGTITGFAEYIATLKKEGRFADVRVLAEPSAIRSTSLWRGMQAVKTPFFAVLDDDDELFPAHYHDLLKVFQKYRDVDVAFSGLVRREEDSGDSSSNCGRRIELPDGTVLGDPRELALFSEFDLRRLLRIDPMFGIHCFLARSEVLTEDVLVDPMFHVIEDCYLYLVMASEGRKFRFNGRVSAVWNWRSGSRDNSMLCTQETIRRRLATRLQSRVAQIGFDASYLGRDVINVGLPIAGEGSSQDAKLSRWEGPVYSASLEEGISFAREGWPAFVDSVAGFSFPERFGRWSLGRRLQLRLRAPLPSEFILEIRGASHEERRAITLAIGSFRARIWLEVWPTRSCFVPVSLSSSESLITIEVPRPVSPFDQTCGQSSDLRLLAVAFERLRFHPAAKSQAPKATPRQPRDAETRIDFRADHFSSDIESLTGVSFREDFGRWTEGNDLYIQFRKSLPSQFWLEIEGYSFGPHEGEALRAEIGRSATAFAIPSGRVERKAILMANPDGADLIRVKIPAATSPWERSGGTQPDRRKLGLALSHLRIIENRG